MGPSDRHDPVLRDRAVADMERRNQREGWSAQGPRSWREAGSVSGGAEGSSTIGRRLRVARAAAGLSLRGLEARIGRRVTAQAISKYERDEAVPGSGVLIALADALQVPVDQLVGAPDVVLGSVEFRKKKLISKREQAQVKGRVLHLLERYLSVEALLGLPSVEWDRPRDAPYPVVDDVAEAEYAARGLRTDWKLGIDPIPNVVELLEGRGIKVLAVDLPTIDGLAARVRRGDEDAATVVVVNRGTWGERQRFTLARELGHMALQVAPRLDVEKAAHRFAGAFLMPAESLRAEIGARRSAIGWDELFDLKRIFGVSVQALAGRCRDLSIFGPVLFRRLFRDFSRFGWRQPPFREPFSMPGEAPKRFKRLCLRALAEGTISEAKAAELMGVPVHDLNRQPPAVTRAGEP